MTYIPKNRKILIKKCKDCGNNVHDTQTYPRSIYSRKK